MKDDTINKHKKHQKGETRPAPFTKSSQKATNSSSVVNTSSRFNSTSKKLSWEEMQKKKGERTLL
jgi:hypothetical protein